MTIKNIYKLLRGYFHKIESLFYSNPDYDDILVSIADIMETNNKKKILKEIKRLFPFSFYFFNKSFFVSLIILYQLRNTNNHKFKLSYPKLLKQIKSKKFLFKNFDNFQKLKQLSILLGFFKLANFFYDNSYFILTNSKHISQKNYTSLILYLVYNNNYDKILDLIGKKKLKYIKDLNTIYTFLTSIVPDENISNSNIFYNKNVVILGPDSSKNELAFNKDAIYIRNNFRGTNYLPNFQKSIPTDVSFYNGECAEYINKNPSILNNLKLKAIYIKDLQYHFDINNISSNIKKNIYNTPNIYSLFSFSSPYMLPIMIIEILSNNPKSLTIYGNNLYLSKTLHNKDYHKDMKINLNKQSYIKAFSIHGIIDNFMFIEYFYKHKLIKVDNYFSQILSKGINKYLEDMENLWT